jgi:hypothetical protein
VAAFPGLPVPALHRQIEPCTGASDFTVYDIQA